MPALFSEGNLVNGLNDRREEIGLSRGLLGKLPTCVPHTDGRRNPKGNPFHPCLWTARHAYHTHSLPLDIIIHSVGTLNVTRCTHRVVKIVFFCHLHTQWLQKLQLQVWQMAPSQRFVLSTEEQSYKSAAAHCQGSGKQKFPSFLLTDSPACLGFSLRQLSLL